MKNKILFLLIIAFLCFCCSLLETSGNKRQVRAVHLLTDDLDSVKLKIDYLAELKINTIILSSGHWFQLDNLINKRKIKNIFDYAKKRGIEIIPELQSFGVGDGILKKNSHAAEGIDVEDEPFIFSNNVAYPVRETEVNMINPSFEKGKTGWELGKDWSLDYDSHKGIFAAKLSFIRPVSEKSSLLRSQTYDILPDSFYSLSFFAKVESITGENPPAVRVVELDAKGNWIRQHSIHIERDNWHRLELNFKTSPQCEKIYIYSNIWEGSGEFWLDEVNLKGMDGALVNVIRANESDITVKAKDGNLIYEEGKDYRIIDGKMEYPYNSNHRSFQIARIPSGRISEGEKVLVSYDYVIRMAPFAPWSVPYCPFEPETYKIMSEALEKIIETLQPKYISIGHDEIRGLNRDSRCKKRNLSNAEILAYDINKLYEIIKELDPEVKILMWDDMLNPWHNGGDENYQIPFGGSKGKTAPAINIIPEDIILMCWWYDSEDWLNKMKNSPAYFKSKGFDYLVAGWKDKENIKSWMEIARDRDDCIGIIITNWDGLEENLEAIEYTAELLQLDKKNEKQPRS